MFGHELDTSLLDLTSQQDQVSVTLPPSLDSTRLSWRDASFRSRSPAAVSSPQAVRHVGHRNTTLHSTASQSQQLNVINKPTFICPVRHDEEARGVSTFSCTAAAFPNMSELRKHIERARHMPFANLCKTCNENFVDKEIFESKHGYNGEKCVNPRKQARGAEATQGSWLQLSELVKSQMNSAMKPPCEFLTLSVYFCLSLTATSCYVAVPESPSSSEHTIIFRRPEGLIATL